MSQSDNKQLISDMDNARKFEPAAVPGSTKYGGQGNVKQELFDKSELPEHVKVKLTSWINHGKANGTWSSYRTAERMALLCQKEIGRKFSWPMTTDDTLTYVYYLVEVRGLRVATVNNYLSGIRQLHVTKGLQPPKLRDEIVRQALKGRANMEVRERSCKESGSQGRLPMTIALMKLLKEKVRTSDLENSTKLMVWAVSTLLFFGAFRISELVSRHESTYDPDQTLLARDVRRVENEDGGVLEIKLKCPKERKSGDPTVVDVFEAKGSLCPIKAFDKWSRKREAPGNLPLFCHEDGTPLTCRKFNQYLKNLLGKHSNFAGGSISAHSFRAGITTILGSKGFSEEEIKLVGRWSSRAFAVYVKGQRTQRAVLARQLGKIGSSTDNA